jgi:cell division ATPase FtsA
LTGAWEEDPGLIALTTAMPNWEEEEFGVALIDIWNNLCCIAIGESEKIYHAINFCNHL